MPKRSDALGRPQRVKNGFERSRLQPNDFRDRFWHQQLWWGPRRVPGPPHFVYISVIGADWIPIVSGIDRMMFGYFASKLAAERIVANSGLPWTTLRAAQFHDFILAAAQEMARLPVIPVLFGFRFQPIDPDEVAGEVVNLTLGTPAGLVPEMGGPQVYSMTELLRGYLRARGKRRMMVPLWIPGKAARAFRAGGNIAPDRAVGHRTWADFLAARVGSPSDSI
jgi:uncharacterized protein YbjT (DUF2867 family)